MDKTFAEINEQAKIKTLKMNTSAMFGFTPLEGRHNGASRQIALLWEFMRERGWSIADHTHRYARYRGSNGWTLAETRELYVKKGGRPVGVQLQVALHEAVHALEMDQFGLFDFRLNPLLRGSVGAEVRAETASCMVLKEITSLKGIVEHSSDYIMYHNHRFAQDRAVFPQHFEGQIKSIAAQLYSVVTG